MTWAAATGKSTAPITRHPNSTSRKKATETRNATGSPRNQKTGPLIDKKVVLFPDLGAEEIWEEKAREIPSLNNSVISHWLSNNATEEMRRKGLDIADILENRNPETKLSITDFL